MFCLEISVRFSVEVLLFLMTFLEVFLKQLVGTKPVCVIKPAVIEGGLVLHMYVCLILYSVLISSSYKTKSKWLGLLFLHFRLRCVCFCFVLDQN